MEMQRLSGPKQISSQDLLNTPDNEANARVLAARLSDITRNLRAALGQPPEILATVIAPELKKLDACVTHQSGLADKLSRTAEMVRRLRNSQSIATDALEEADTKPLIAAETAPDTKPQLTSRIVINKSVPEFVSSDDDIFADDKSPATQAEVQSGQVKETDPTQEASAPPAPLIDLTKLPEIGNDTLNFSNIEVPPMPLTVSDEEESTAAEAPDQEPEAEPAIEVADHQTSRVDQTPDAPEQPTERTFSVVRKPNPQAQQKSSNGNGHISMNRPVAANQSQHSGKATPSAPEAKSNKRIIVIRRPADDNSSIPMANGDTNNHPGGPSAA